MNSENKNIQPIINIIMNRAKYLSVIFLGTLVYVLLSASIGQNSLKCYKKMEEQKRIVSKRTTEIQNINNELQLEKTSLKSDMTVIAAYAKKLDYVSDNEKLVKITGLKPAQNALYDTGSVLRHKDPEYVSEKFCKMVALILAGLWFIILFLYDINKGNISFKREQKPMTAGIPIYDLPQI